MFRFSSSILLATALVALTNGVQATDGIVDRDRSLFSRPVSPVWTVRELQLVEQRVEDVNPLATGLRQLDFGLRQPFGFEDVYRVPGEDDYFMRIEGGIYAVFPQSVYTSKRFGEQPLIPAGTVFWIGPPDFLLTGPGQPSAQRADESVRRAFVLDHTVMDVSAESAFGSFVTEPSMIGEGSFPLMDRGWRSQTMTNHTARTRRPIPFRAIEASDADANDSGRTVAPGEETSSEDDESFRKRVQEMLQRAAKAESTSR